MSTVLIVDDKEMMRDSVAATLRKAGFEVRAAGSGEQAVRLAAEQRPDAVVTDLKMPGMTGLQLLEGLREIDDELPVILMTAFGTIETAVEAMRLGAFDYVTKPFEGDELIIAVKRAISHGRIVRENALLRAEVSTAPGATPRPGAERLIGRSPAIERVRQQVRAIAGSQGTVLICGESGVGKEVVARAIHEESERAGSPFLAVNCAALSESLMESELFGHERGSFTGADALRKGRFELANAGTLLLDEVSEVSTQVQSKLLRVLQERSFERVGSSVSIGVDVRVIATSNRDLPQSVADGKFRQDLFFRLNVLPIHVPPLRERREDVGVLAQHFVAQFAERERCGEAAFDARAMSLLESYAWPGNVRELQNVCERAVVLLGAKRRAGQSTTVINSDMIEAWLIPSAARALAQAAMATNGHTNGTNGSGENGASRTDGTSPMVEAKPAGPMGRVHIGANGELLPLEQVEREAIIGALRRFSGHRQKTAKALGIGVRTLGLKLKKWKEQELVEPTL